MMPRWTTLFLDLPAEAFEPGVRFWRAVTGSGLSAPRGEAGQFATLLPPHGDAWLRVQRVDGGPGGVHLDLHLDPAGDGGPEQAAARAVGLGAVERFQEPGLVVLESPGGFGFCLVQHEGELTVPPPLPDLAVAAGATSGAASEAAGASETVGLSRADQLCLDVPAALYEDEVAFWSALTGWPVRAGSLPAFRSLQRPEGVPLRILFQCRERSAAGDRVSGHVDLATTDRSGLTGRHVAAGAQVLSVNPFWTVLQDPTGRAYCLTDRNPLTGTL